LIEKHLYPSAALHGQVAHEIGRRIVSGGIAEGEFLPREAELSEQFSVSRQAIREALKVLAAKGLVKSRRRAGTYVTPRSSWNLLDPDVLAWHPPAELDPDFLADLVELRRLIEPAATQMAAKRGDPGRIEGIGAALARMREAIGNPIAYHSADAEFHMAIFAASGNTLIERLSNILGPLLEMSLRLQGEVGVGHESSVAMHAAIYDAIVAGDVNRAKRALESVLSLAASEVLVLAEQLRRNVTRRS
jgi:DNA-binding FadR family transcriptional regulator